MVPPIDDPLDEGLEELVLGSEAGGDQPPAVAGPLADGGQRHRLVAALHDEVSGGFEQPTGRQLRPLLVAVRRRGSGHSVVLQSYWLSTNNHCSILGRHETLWALDCRRRRTGFRGRRDHLDPAGHRRTGLHHRGGQRRRRRPSRGRGGDRRRGMA